MKTMMMMMSATGVFGLIFVKLVANCPY